MKTDTSLRTIDQESWFGFAASVPGNGHIRYGIPCQDASLVMTSPRPALIVCDGRGSASLSHYGAQAATVAFRRQVSIMEPFLRRILDREEVQEEQWIKICRVMYRTLMQVKYDLAEEHGAPEQEFDFTVVFAIVGVHHIGCFQVGDGALVLRQNHVCRTVFQPDKGQYANQTLFLRSGGEETMKFQYALHAAKDNSGIAASSDGPEYLMFHLADMKPGKLFDVYFDALIRKELKKQDVMDYLTRKVWADDPRGADDRSLALLANTEESVLLLEDEPTEEHHAEETDGQENRTPEKGARNWAAIPPLSFSDDADCVGGGETGEQSALAKGRSFLRKKLAPTSAMLLLACGCLGSVIYGLEQNRLCECARAEARAAESECRKKLQEIDLYEQKVQQLRRQLLATQKDLLIQRWNSSQKSLLHSPEVKQGRMPQCWDDLKTLFQKSRKNAPSDSPKVSPLLAP